METNEFIALFMITGGVALGVSVPLYKYIKKLTFILSCLTFVVIYTLLSAHSLHIASDMPETYENLFKSANLQNYVSAAFNAIVYLILGMWCSHAYEEMRQEKKRKLISWIGIPIWGILALPLYILVTRVEASYIYFNTCVGIFGIFAVAIVMLIFPFLISLIPAKK